MRGRSSVISVELPSPRRGTCCATSSCIRERSLSNVLFATMLVAGEMPWLDIYAHMQVSECVLSVIQQYLIVDIFFKNVLIQLLNLMDAVVK